jgi:Mg-chelatase subunit ChlD
MKFASTLGYVSKRKALSKFESKEKSPEQASDSDESSGSLVSENEVKKFHSSDSEDEKDTPRKASNPMVKSIVPKSAAKSSPKHARQRIRNVKYSSSESEEEPHQAQRKSSTKRDNNQANQTLQMRRSMKDVSSSGSESSDDKESSSSSDSEPEVQQAVIKKRRQIGPGGSATLQRKPSLTNINHSSDEDEEKHIMSYQVQKAKLSKGERRIQEAAKRQSRIVFNKVDKKKEAKKSESVKDSEKHYKQEIDTNVLAFDMSVLKDEKDVFTGDPIFCSNCKAVLNVYSQITNPEDEKEQLWTCEFCGYPNKIQIESEDQPKKDEVTYILKVAPIKEEKKKEGSKVNEERKTIIFCVDISGSMNTKQNIKIGENVSIGELRELMRSMGYRYKDWKKKDLIALERLECIKLALERQVAKLSKDAPNTKIGIVTFESSIVFIGDGTCSSIEYDSDTFKDYKKLIEDAEKDAKGLMSNSVSVSKDKLIKRLRNMKTMGATALGPGLAVALGAAFKSGPGSRIILCTDGEANEGPGAMDYSRKKKGNPADFYTEIGEMAKEKGVTISLISIVGDSCRLDVMGSMAELTGGEILKINPLNLVSEFDSIVSNSIIATNVELKVKLHKGLSFRNEKPDSLLEDGSLLVRSLGNVTADEEVTVEYHTKSAKKLKILEIDFSKITSLPFQAQITYFTLSGAKCLHLITKKQDITFEKEEAKKEADYNIIASNAIKQSSKLAREGNINKSRISAVHWKSMLKGTSAYEDYMVDMAPLYSALEQQNEGTAAAADWLVSEISKASKLKFKLKKDITL